MCSEYRLPFAQTNMKKRRNGAFTSSLTTSKDNDSFFFSVCTWSSSRLAWELGSLQPASFYCECRLVGLIVPVKSSGSLSAVYSPRLSDIDFTSILHHSFDITVFFYVTYPTSHKEYSRYMQEKLNQLWLWCSVWQLFRNAFLQDN